MPGLLIFFKTKIIELYFRKRVAYAIHAVGMEL